MTKNYRTAQGKQLDMAALAARNEKVRAVGNMKVNARGDTIDGTGKVLVPVTQKVGQTYQKTVGHRSSQIKKPNVTKPELTKDELDLVSSEQDDIEVEKIKANEKNKK